MSVRSAVLRPDTNVHGDQDGLNSHIWLWLGASAPCLGAARAAQALGASSSPTELIVAFIVTPRRGS